MNLFQGLVSHNCAYNDNDVCMIDNRSLSLKDASCFLCKKCTEIKHEDETVTEEGLEEFQEIFYDAEVVE